MVLFSHTIDILFIGMVARGLWYNSYHSRFQSSITAWRSDSKRSGWIHLGISTFWKQEVFSFEKCCGATSAVTCAPSFEHQPLWQIQLLTSVEYEHGLGYHKQSWHHAQSYCTQPHLLPHKYGILFSNIFIGNREYHLDQDPPGWIVGIILLARPPWLLFFWQYQHWSMEYHHSRIRHRLQANPWNQWDFTIKILSNSRNRLNMDISP